MNKKKLTLLIALSIIIVITAIILMGAVQRPNETIEIITTTTIAATTTTTTTTIIPTTTTTAVPISVAQQVWNTMKAKGWDDNVCAGILGNIMAECGGGTLKLQPYANGDGNTSFGLCQWHKERKNAMLKFNNQNYNTKNNLPTIQHQIDFLEYELQKYNINIINSGKNYKEIAYVFCIEFERPNNKYKKAEKRKQFAAIAYQEFAI